MNISSGSFGFGRLGRAAFVSGRAATLAVAASLLLSRVPTPVFAAGAEGCPGTTALAAGFTWAGGAWTADGDSAGISVWGDTALARWSTTGASVGGVVITAGAVTINYTYDPGSVQGAVAASDVESASGAPLAHLGFCTGTATNPTSGSKISVGVSKTAACAVGNADHTATVQGTITVVRHKPADDPNAPSVAIRVRTTRDTVFAGNGPMLGEVTSISGLTGAVMAPGTDTMTAPYTVTFQPGSATTFANKIEITVEEAVSGLDRHKYYAAWAGFELCGVLAATPTPTPTGKASPTTFHTPGQSPMGSPEGSAKGIVGSPGTGLPNTAVAPPTGSTSNAALAMLLFAIVFLGSLGTLALVRLNVRRQPPR